MSISDSLYIGASGLLAHGNAMSVVGDNIANASTIGFKRGRASFADMLGGEMVNQRMGGGAYLGHTQTMWAQGSIAQTGNPMDVAITGDGMFVVKGSHGGVDQTLYSRDGRFQLDNSGFVVDQQGLRVQGYTINADGTRTTDIGDLALGQHQSPPVATTKATIDMNLGANDAVGSATPFDPTNPATTSQYQTSMVVHDSLGNAHTVQLYFHNNGTGSWDYHAMADGKELTGGTPGTPVEIGTGTLQFDTSGNLTTQTGSITANFVNAGQNQAIAMDFGKSTQTANNDGVTALTIDGHGSGNLSSLKIDPDGKVEGVYDNGDKLVLAQIALAKVPNTDGLERMGDGLWSANPASGQAIVEAPGIAGRGSLVAGALEASNVDLGTELVTLIAYQRAFQANAKTVTTADEMLTDVNNIKR